MQQARERASERAKKLKCCIGTYFHSAAPVSFFIMSRFSLSNFVASHEFLRPAQEHTRWPDLLNQKSALPGASKAFPFWLIPNYCASTHAD